MRGIAVLACLGLAGCFFGDDDGDPAPHDPDVTIAVGATVDVPLHDNCNRALQELCLERGSIASISEITVDSDIFTMGQRS